ncbi:MAG: hypothetical protein JST65_13840 [Acidobacteria bacterium]|nr:hypothetical protein [Acidobacteriota bacterium]
MIPMDDFDPLAPQREAALFYGLFMRGHSADALRSDIDIEPHLINKWLTHRGYSASRENFQKVYQYRKQVLAIFDELVDLERNRSRAAAH